MKEESRPSSERSQPDAGMRKAEKWGVPETSRVLSHFEEHEICVEVTKDEAGLPGNEGAWLVAS